MDSNQINKESNKETSLPRKRGQLTVAASPFNSVKLDLGVILVLSVLAWLVIDRLVDGSWMQFFYLGACGIIFMSWLIFRTRRIINKLSATDQNPDENDSEA